MKKTADYRKYETYKRRVQNIGLTPAQYEEVLKIIAEALGL